MVSLWGVCCSGEDSLGKVPTLPILLASPAVGHPGPLYCLPSLTSNPFSHTNLPPREQLSKLGAHVELATRLTASVDASRLTEFGKLEQDLVYGDATSKEVIALLSQSGSIPPAEKVGGDSERTRGDRLPARTDLVGGDSVRHAAAVEHQGRAGRCQLVASPVANTHAPAQHLTWPVLTPLRCNANTGAPAHVLLRHAPREDGPSAGAAVAEGGGPTPR